MQSQTSSLARVFARDIDQIDPVTTLTSPLLHHGLDHHTLLNTVQHLIHNPFQLSSLLHLQNDVAATQQFTLNINLWVQRWKIMMCVQDAPVLQYCIRVNSVEQSLV